MKHLDDSKHLGITLDKLTTCKEQCESVKTKAVTQTNTIRKLVGTIWMLFNRYVEHGTRPVLDGCNGGFLGK